MNKTLLTLAAGATLLGGCCLFDCGPYPETIDEGFVSLFNGKDLSGWEGSEKFAVETIETKLNNGTTRKTPVIAYTPGADDKCRNLVSAKEYENFVLRFDFLLPAGGDNGLGIRTPGADVNAAYDGMCEIQLLDDGASDYYDAAAKKDKLAPYRYAASAFGIAAARRDNVDKQIWGKDANFAGAASFMRKPGVWNFMEVRVIGSEIEVHLNGYLVTKTDVAQFKGDGDTPDGKKHPGLHNKKGRISFCGDASTAKFKNVRIKEL